MQWKYSPPNCLKCTCVEILKVAIKPKGKWKLTLKYCEKGLKMTSVNMVREQYVGEKKSTFCPNIPNDIFEGLEIMEGICIPTKGEIGHPIGSCSNTFRSSSFAFFATNGRAKINVDIVVGKFSYGCGIPFNILIFLYFQVTVETINFYDRTYNPLMFLEKIICKSK